MKLLAREWRRRSAHGGESGWIPWRVAAAGVEEGDLLGALPVARLAHRDAAGWLSGLGDAPEPTNLTKMAGGSEVEDDGDGGDAGAPAVCFSARRKRGSGRISWVLRVAVRSTVATANGVGDDGGAATASGRGGAGRRRCRGGAATARWRQGGAATGVEENSGGGLQTSN